MGDKSKYICGVRKYLSLVKFSHTVFALPFALIGFFLAVKQTTQPVNWKLFLLVLICMVSARNAAMAFNRYLDRDVDSKNPRTKNREIPAGIISASHAMIFTVISCVIFIAATFFINRICFLLSPVALAVILGYSYTKRFTSLSHFVLGLGLSLAPIGAYLAVTAQFAWIPVLISFAVLTWVGGFDIIYSLQDDEFDKRENLFSIPVQMGRKNSLRFSLLVHLLTNVILLLVGISGGFGWLYWAGFVIFISLLIYQHSIVSADDLSKVNIAFGTTNGIASILFAAFVLLDLFIR